MGEEMVVIREYLNEMQALVARSVLEAYEIPAVVLRDDAGGMLPSLWILLPARLAVRAADSEDALRILDEHEQNVEAQEADEGEDSSQGDTQEDTDEAPSEAPDEFSDEFSDDDNDDTDFKS